jgi:hypothetical protein
MGLTAKIRSAAANTVLPMTNAAGTAAEHFADLNARLAGSLAALRSGRDGDTAAAFAEDFTLVLRAWGMTKDDIPRVISELYLRVAIFVCLFALAFLLVTQGAPVLGSMVFICASVGILTTFWRICVLSGGAWFPFPGQRLLSFFVIKKAGDSDGGKR